GLVIEGVIERMSEFTEEKVVVNGPADENETIQEVEVPETGVETNAEADAPSEVSHEEVMQEYSDMPTPVPNTVVTGKVVQIGTDEVLVDIGYKSEGRIPLNEMGLKPNQEPKDAFTLEQEVDVWVLKVDDAEG